MANQHRYPARALRPPPPIWEQAATHATARDLDMNTYLVACVRWLAEDPKGALRRVGPFLTGPAPRGRPKKQA